MIKVALATPLLLEEEKDAIQALRKQIAEACNDPDPRKRAEVRQGNVDKNRVSSNEYWSWPDFLSRTTIESCSSARRDA